MPKKSKRKNKSENKVVETAVKKEVVVQKPKKRVKATKPKNKPVFVSGVPLSKRRAAIRANS